MRIGIIGAADMGSTLCAQLTGSRESKELRIPFPRRRMIDSKEADGAQSAQRGRCCHVVPSLFS